MFALMWDFYYLCVDIVCAIFIGNKQCALTI